MKNTKSMLIVILILFAGCVSIVRYDGPYEGRVIDAATGEPIQGAVVLGTWYVVRPIIFPGFSEYHDAMETVTDQDGNFTIKGMGWRVLSNMEPMNVLIFKAGYEHVGMVPWASLRVDELLKGRITWEGERAIIPLRRLTKEEREDRFGSYYVNIPNEKQSNMLNEIKKEKEELEKTKRRHK